MKNQDDQKPDSSSLDTSRENAVKLMIDERTARARKMVMPSYITPAEKKEEKLKKKTEQKEIKKAEKKKLAEEKQLNKPKRQPAKEYVKTINKDEEKRILDLDCKKHFKMFLLHKGGYSNKEIAELITHGNVGYVGNEIKKYAEDPNRENKFKP